MGVSRRALFGLLGAVAAAPMLPRTAKATVADLNEANLEAALTDIAIRGRYPHTAYALGYVITGRDAAGRRVRERILHDPGAADMIDRGGWT
jgi:hypothetical protein